MTTVLITGAAGQLGSELRARTWPTGTKLVPVTIDDVDITDDAAVSSAVAGSGADVVVNAAAYTAVDEAEDDRGTAHRVNADGVANLAHAAGAVGARLIHVSTDYVFDGSKDGWYVESDPIAPLGVYGQTKAAGETAARSIDRHVILRTAWVYSAHPPNFVITMRRLGRERDELGVVADQVGCPTSAADLARAIVDIIADHPDLTGTYHLASPTAATWHEFANAILADRIDAGLTIAPLTTTDYPTRARRPANSRLDSSHLRSLGIGVRSWQDALPDVLAQIDQAEAEAS